MASDFEKPDKVHTLFPDEIETKMWPLSVGELFGCGKSTAEKLERMHIHTIGALAEMDMDLLKRSFGDKTALYLHNASNGIDESEVSNEQREAKSYSVETTTEENLTDMEAICHLLRAQADEVGFRLRSDDVKARCITVSYITGKFERRSHGRKQDNATDITKEIYVMAVELMREAWKGEPLRLVSISASEIDHDGYEQMTLIGNETREKQKRLDRALDDIRNRYGKGSIVRAGIGEFRADRR
jgi:DNA polymerase-4